MGGLRESLVQEVGALTVEMDGALVVGQGLAVMGIGGSQEAGQPIHRHWAQEGGTGEAGCRLLLSPVPVSLQQGWRRRWPHQYLPLILVTGERVSTCWICWTKSFGSCSWGGRCQCRGWL